MRLRSQEDDKSDEPEEDIDNFWTHRLQAADKLEIRLDATLVSCHTLARFLSYDTTLPPKDMPGFEVADVIMILDTFTSAVVLSLFWTAAGLVTQIFEDDNESWGLLAQTTFLAAPPWLLMEILLGWPVAESGAVERFVLGTLGLLATMSLSRLVPKFLR